MYDKSNFCYNLSKLTSIFETKKTTSIATRSIAFIIYWLYTSEGYNWPKSSATSLYTEKTWFLLIYLDFEFSSFIASPRT